MKHHFLLKALLCASIFNLLPFTFHLSQAQVGSSFTTNMFLSGKAGAVLYSNANGAAFGFGGGVSMGKWVAEPLALRFGADVVMVANRRQTLEGGSTMHLFPSLDAMWDPMAVIERGPQDWNVRLYPFVGIGGLFRGGDKEMREKDYNVFQVSLGLHAPFSFSRYSKVAGFLEYRFYCHPDNFDGNHCHNGMHTFALGLTRRFNSDPYHRRTAQESHTSRDDWFFGGGIGPNFSSFDLFANIGDGMAMVGVAPEIMVGRNYSNFWTLRLELTGLSAHEQFDTLTSTAERYMFTFLHADLMVNISHALSFKRGVRWNVLPFIGVGPVWRYDKMNMNMAGNLGVMFRRYINEAGDFFIDAKYAMVPPSIGGGTGPSGNIYMVGIPSITVGYIYNFGVTSTRYRLPASHSTDCVL